MSGAWRENLRSRPLPAVVAAIFMSVATAPSAPAQNEPAAPAAPPGGAVGGTTAKSEPKSKNLEPLAADQTAAILGKKVKGPQGEELGLVVDVVVDAGGHPVAAVIDFGGFLGVGNRKIAVDWRALNFSPGNRTGEIELSLGRDELKAAPEYKPDAPVAVMVATPPASTSLPDVSK
jgi:hypothetical protein